MLADLCFLWDFKTYGQAYAEAMANRALASFSWQDTVNLWLSRKFHAQRLKATALGMHCTTEYCLLIVIFFDCLF
jgi:hypothetical protein